MNLKEALARKLTKNELGLLHRSFDVIGDIAIIDIPKELKRKEKVIANALLGFNNLKTVLKKAGKVKGRLRTRKLVWIAGEKRRETIHKESGCRFKLNVDTCYYSPRLSTDRLDIAKQVKKGESVLVMFSGVGPAPIVIAKNSKAKEILGIEINRIASKYALENIKLNKLSNTTLIQGDVKRIIPKLVKKKLKFDRIVMTRPQLKETFLVDALKVAKKGTIFNMHDFVDEKDMPRISLSRVEDALKKSKGRLKKYRLIRWKKAGNIAPRKFRIRLDFVVG